MLKPICVPCRRFFRPKTNGYRFIEGMPIVPYARSGRAEPEKWKPYKIWIGDLWYCQGCGTTIVSGVAAWPLAEHYQEGFADKLTADLIQINDC